ncbi:MAG TPA: hypothetical protein VF875_09720 [Anaeromyxobacter sp.]
MPWDRSRRSVLGAVLVAGGAAGACFGVIEGGGDALVAVAVAAAGGLALGVGAAVLLARRAQLQPPLQADPLPAAVAHRMSSPLSALRTNLEWLRDALEAGRLREPRDAAEAREVLRDARDATEALRADVGQLRAAARAPGEALRR